MTNVAPYIFLGNKDNAADWDFLKRNEIENVLNVTKTVPNFFESDDRVSYTRIPLDDAFNQPLKDYLTFGIALMEKAVEQQKGVLVHCSAGMSRSPCLVMAYFMKKNNWTLDRTYNWLKTLRPICPNICFMGQLLHFQDDCTSTIN
jgi:protein-tyrosine phosphatase